MIEIEAQALQQLLLLQRNLPAPCAGLRLRLQGDACHGWQATLEWGGALRTEERAVELQGLTVMARADHWPYLQGATLTCGVREQEPGVWVELRASACQCDTKLCAS